MLERAGAIRRWPPNPPGERRRGERWLDGGITTTSLPHPPPAESRLPAQSTAEPSAEAGAPRVAIPTTGGRLPRATAALTAILWLVVTAAALATRPLLPVDETRYSAVAWEMWTSGSYLVPHLNGATYSHKPPLLFWLINAGWQLGGGPSMAWVRLVGPLCAALDLWLVYRLARRLWPRRPDVALLAPVVLLGTLLWTVYGTLLLFDTLLTTCVLLGLLGLVQLRDGQERGAALLAVGLGLGVLAKGPVVLLHLLPVALLASWWGRDAAAPGAPEGEWPRGQRSVRGARWAGWVTAGVLGGVVIALLWAVPAALTGGPVYGRQIFLGQTTGRMVSSFAHGRPIWWYLPQLLWILAPWWAWPAVWRGVGRLRAAPLDRGTRFCLAWAVPALVAFSLVSGKQVHYLIPELAAVALIIARALAAPAPLAGPGATAGAVLWPALALALPGTVLLAAELLPGRLLAALPPGIALPPPWSAALLALVPPAVALAGAALLARPRRPRAQHPPPAGGSLDGGRAMALTAATVALVALMHAVALPGVAPRYDLTAVSRHLGSLDRAGVPLAHVGPYAGQYTFLGRLRHPLTEISAAEVGGWLASHPDGRVVTYTRDSVPLPGPSRDAEFAQRSGKGWVVVERARQRPAADHP